ncbi:MAG: hypothetical protein AAFY67_12200 [Cyanobacteria bacterium J06642_9]
MAFPSYIRYFGMRLRPLAQPVVWFPTVVIVLLGTVLWQYRAHPEWSGQFEVDESTPNAGTLLPEGEVPGDQPLPTSGESEREGLMKLLADLGLLGPERQSDELGTVPQVQQETPESLLSLLVEPESLADPDAEGTTQTSRQRLAGTLNPFDRYADAYQLPGSAGAIANGRASTTSSNTSNISDFLNFLNFNQANGDGSETQTAGNDTTALERALNQRQIVAEETPASNNEAQETADANNTAQSTLEAQDSPQNPAVVQGNIPGIPYTFIQTTPQMSPPPGTTGYSVPPSFNVAPPAAANNGGVPGVNTGATAVPSFQTPTPSSGVSGSTLPPTSGSQYNQPQFVSPRPFSAPRPNSRIIGNGEIQTFSNPLGSSSWDPSDYNPNR